VFDFVGVFMMNKMRDAFTMMELLVVIAIIGVLLAFVGPRIVEYMKKGKETEVKLKFNNIKQALVEYKMEFGRFPAKQDGGLEALVHNPHPNDEKFKKAEAAGKWPFVKDEGTIAQDGVPFIYNMPPEKFKNKYRYFELVWLGETQSEEAPDLMHAGE
jgi:type II secretion system protein G